jgi:recombinational DNA repair protein RecR
MGAHSRAKAARRAARGTGPRARDLVRQLRRDLLADRPTVRPCSSCGATFQDGQVCGYCEEPRQHLYRPRKR